MLRVVMAGLFVFGGMLLAVAALSQLGWNNPPTWLLVPVMIVLFFILIGIALWLFSGEALGKSAVDTVRDWEAQGLLVSTEFRARRAFQVEEFEDEGSHYFLELEDGGVLYLNGQYLYDYEAIEDDEPGFNHPRRFPCTEFTRRAHRDRGFTVDLLCRGGVLEPEAVQPPLTTEEWRRFHLTDGDIIRDRAYEELLALRAGERFF